MVPDGAHVVVRPVHIVALYSSVTLIIAVIVLEFNVTMIPFGGVSRHLMFLPRPLEIPYPSDLVCHTVVPCRL